MRIRVDKTCKQKIINRFLINYLFFLNLNFSIMNKAIYLCAAAALALASCSNDETVEVAKGDNISFRTAVGLNTRGTAVDQTTFEATNQLYVTTFAADGSSLFKETLYTKGADGWTGGQYWGTNEQLNFYLSYPALASLKTDFELTENDKTITEFTVKDKIAEQVDFVFGKALNTAKTANAVDVDLNHMLSQIEVQALSNNTSYNFKVSGVRFQNANNKGDIDLSTETWANQAGSQNFEVTYTNGIDLTATATTIMGTDGNAMLVPQNVTKWNGTDKSADTTTPVTGSYISVLISITTDKGAAVYPNNTSVDNPTYGWVSVPVDFAWEKGKKYIYKLDFSKGAGVVDPVNPNPDGKDDVKPGDKDPDKTEPVLGDQIKFTVDVINWVDSNNDVDM